MPKKSGIPEIPEIPVLGLEDFQPTLPFTEEQFRRELQLHLDTHQIHLRNQRLLKDLFKIASESAREYALADKMRTRDAERDWKARRRLIDKLSSRVDKDSTFLEQYCKPELPFTNVLAMSLLKEFCKLGKTLARAEAIHRANYSMAQKLKNARYPGEFSIGVNDFLKAYAPYLSGRERDIVIAGCLSACAFYPAKDRGKDLVARIPMQLSRSERDYVGEPRVVFRGSVPRPKKSKK